MLKEDKLNNRLNYTKPRLQGSQVSKYLNLAQLLFQFDRNPHICN